MWKMIGSIPCTDGDERRRISLRHGAAGLFGKTALYPAYHLYAKRGIEYTKSPLGEVFGRAAVRVREPYKGWLHGLERQVERREEDEFFKIWMRCIDRYLRTLHLKSEHAIQLKELGSYLGKMDSTSESLHLKFMWNGWSWRSKRLEV